jgi:hypothetical protein
MRHHWLLLIPVLSSLAGCVGFGPPAASNPIFVRTGDHEALWEDTIDVLHAYQFPVERESQIDGSIQTGYKPGAGVLEPWHHDAATFPDRLEGSLQSIRRRASFTLTPANGGYYVGVEVLKEIEDPQRLIINSPGYATFNDSKPLQRDLDVVIGPATPDGWILLGRDVALEQSLLGALQTEVVRR